MFTDLHRCILALDPIAIWLALKRNQPRHEARVDARTISSVAQFTGPRFDWAVCVCVRVCVCLLVLLQVCRFRLNVEDSKMGGTKRLGRCQGAELLAHLVIRDRGERSGFVLLLVSRHCHGNG